MYGSAWCEQRVSFNSENLGVCATLIRSISKKKKGRPQGPPPRVLGCRPAGYAALRVVGSQELQNGLLKNPKGANPANPKG